MLPADRPDRAPALVSLELALQGGGAHGAFTWGALDRLLDEDGIEIVAISGASAGAVNAVLLAHGLMQGGRAAGQRALWQFWKNVGRAAHAARLSAGPFAPLFAASGPAQTEWAPFALWSATQAAWRAFAETAVGGFGGPAALSNDLNPLRRLLAEAVDFDRLRAADAPRLFLSATDVATGALRVFRNADLTPEAVLASACLPQLFRAVEIEGRAYWDGGYLANPPLAPLIAEADAHDLLIIQLTPPERREAPRGAVDIAARLNEIVFNASLVNELRAIGALQRALAAGAGVGGGTEPLFTRLAGLRLHRISADETVFALGDRGQLYPEWSYLQRLHQQGADAAAIWLGRHRADLGRRATLKFPPDAGALP
ncbi:patatin-like phospholipase family protein [Rubritepida flocculans]|uniref:patatin-like phospholipase family protein n=1 Tax=Rubritepida flocculans TaxID=182403 RepID=UPI00041254C2|nr:patatin-like phospholipase family protein [Rubritepida flocculans]